MESTVPYIIYLISAFIVSVYLSRRTDRKVLTFALVFWIFSEPYLDAMFIISFPGLPFEFQPNRILLIFLFFYLLLGHLFSFQKYSITSATPPFEKYMYFYILVVTLSLMYNYSDIRQQLMGAVPAAIFTFIIIYQTGKRYITVSSFDAIIKAIIILSVVCSFIALLQIFYDADFLRAGRTRLAFSDIYRATGIFAEEYEFGVIQILAYIIIYSKYGVSHLSKLLIPLLVISILMTFHRLDIMILILCTSIYFWFFQRSYNKFIFPLSILFIAFLSLTFLYMFESELLESAFVQGRLLEEHESIRARQWDAIFTELKEYAFLGLGGYGNPTYSEIMGRYDLLQSMKLPNSEWIERGYIPHSGYLEVLVLYGVLAFIIFISFFYSILRYFYRTIDRYNPGTSVPFFTALIWATSNTTNGMISFSAYSTLLYALIFGIYIGKHSIDVKQQNRELTVGSI